MPVARTTAAALRPLCGGAVHLPGDPAYDAFRERSGTGPRDAPVAVAYPAFPDEVADLLRVAAGLGLTVVVQGSGHGGPAARRPLSGSVLLRTSAMTELVVDAAGRTARAGAGVLWGEVVDLAAREGLAALHPPSAEVGVVGSSLRCSTSWYARALGLQPSAVTALDVVLPGGEQVRADPDREPELFWGLRGGGAGLGVVTAVEFDLFPYADCVAGALAWDVVEAGRVLQHWVSWCATAPDAATTCWRVTGAPGRPRVVVDGAVLGTDRLAAGLLAPLRALRPEVDTFTRTGVGSLPHRLPRPPDALLSGVLPDAAAVRPDLGAPLELRHLGGALGRPDPRGGVLDRLAGAFLALRPPPTSGDDLVPVGPGEDVRHRLAVLRRQVDPAGLLVPS